jgi:hypothetical protein
MMISPSSLSKAELHQDLADQGNAVVRASMPVFFQPRLQVIPCRFREVQSEWFAGRE